MRCRWRCLRWAPTHWRRRTSPWDRSMMTSRAAISASGPGSCRRREPRRPTGWFNRTSPCGQFRRPIRPDRRVKQQHAEHHPHRGGRRRILLLAKPVPGLPKRTVDLRDQWRCLQRVVWHGALAGVVLWHLGRAVILWHPCRAVHLLLDFWCGTAATAGSALLDDALFMPGTTLTVDGTPGNDQFTFDADVTPVTVSLNGEVHSFTLESSPTMSSTATAAATRRS